MVKNLPTNAGDARDLGLIPGLGRSPGGGYGNPLQNSRLKNPSDREAWQAVVHRVRKNQTGLKQLSIRRDMSCFLKLLFHLSNINTHIHAYCSVI